MNSDKPFSYFVDMLIAYPKTKNLDNSDFVAPTCYYTCEEENDKVKCDLKPCIEYIGKRKFVDKRAEVFTKKFVEELTDTSKYLTAKFDGFHIQYTPDEQEKAINLINILRENSGSSRRTGVIELNSERLNMIKGLN